MTNAKTNPETNGATKMTENPLDALKNAIAACDPEKDAAALAALQATLDQIEAANAPKPFTAIERHSGAEPFAIHRTGCRCAKKDALESDGHTSRHATLQDAIDHLLDDEIRGLGYDEGSLKIFQKEPRK
jgi:hypothetical protein